MRTYRKIALRLGACLGIYFLLNVSLQHSDFRKGITVVYCFFQKPVFNVLNSDLHGEFTFNSRKKDKKKDLRIDVTHQNVSTEYSLMFDIRSKVFLPIFLFLALILASPISWLRRFIGFLVGLSLLCVLLSSHYSNFMQHMFVESGYVPSSAYEKFNAFMSKAWYSEGYLMLMIAIWLLVLLLPNPFKRNKITET